MLTQRRWMIVLGTVISLLLLAVVFVRLDWPTFWSAVQRVSLPWLATAGVVTIGGTLLRALRWMLIAGASLEHFRFYCHATHYGYLANAILPARAGEAVRMLFVARSTNTPMPKAMTSAVVDRLADLAMLGIVMLLVAANHGTKVFGQHATLGIIGVLIISMFGMLLFLLKGEYCYRLLQSFSKRLPKTLGSRLPRWYMEAYNGVQPLRSPWRMMTVMMLNLVVALADYTSMWLVIFAFGWSLPVWAALTVGALISAGTALPSAPGYVGIYQVACILALRLYGVNEASAVAYAIILQLLNLLVTVLLSVISMIDSRIAADRRMQQTPASL